MMFWVHHDSLEDVSSTENLVEPSVLCDAWLVLLH